MEELKMLVELASSIADGAFWLIILYFIKEVIGTVLVFSGFMIIPYMIIKTIFRLCNIESKCHRIMVALDLYPEKESWPLQESEVRKIIRKIDDLKKEKK